MSEDSDIMPLSSEAPSISNSPPVVSRNNSQDDEDGTSGFDSTDGGGGSGGTEGGTEGEVEGADEEPVKRLSLKIPTNLGPRLTSARRKKKRKKPRALSVAPNLPHQWSGAASASEEDDPNNIMSLAVSYEDNDRESQLASPLRSVVGRQLGRHQSRMKQSSGVSRTSSSSSTAARESSLRGGVTTKQKRDAVLPTKEEFMDDWNPPRTPLSPQVTFKDRHVVAGHSFLVNLRFFSESRALQAVQKLVFVRSVVGGLVFNMTANELSYNILLRLVFDNASLQPVPLSDTVSVTPNEDAALLTSPCIDGKGQFILPDTLPLTNISNSVSHLCDGGKGDVQLLLRMDRDLKEDQEKALRVMCVILGQTTESFSCSRAFLCDRNFEVNARALEKTFEAFLMSLSESADRSLVSKSLRYFSSTTKQTEVLGTLALLEGPAEGRNIFSYQDEYGRTILHFLAQLNCEKTLRMLFSHLCDQLAVPSSSSRMKPQPLSTLKLSHLDVVDADGYPPLHYAILLKKLPLITTFLMAGSGKSPFGPDQAPLSYYVEASGLTLEWKKLNNSYPHLCDSTVDDAIATAIKDGAVEDLSQIEPSKIATFQTCLGGTAMHLAAVSSSLEVVEHLLKIGLGVKEMDESGAQPLHYAAAQGNVDMVKLFLSTGLRITIQTLGGLTPLHIACSYGYTQIVVALLSRKKTSSRSTTRHYHSSGGPRSTSHRLSSKKYSMPEPHYRSSGARASARISPTTSPRTLSSRFAKVPALQYTVALTPMQLCIRNGHSHLFPLIFPLDKSKKMQVEVMYYSCDLGRSDVLSLVLEAGADANEVSTVRKHHFTALHVSSLYGWNRCCKLLLRHGAEINSLSSTKATPLHIAASYGRAETILILMKKKSNASLLDKEGRSALHHAASNGRHAALTALLPYSTQNDYSAVIPATGDTPLHLAAKAGSLECTRALVYKLDDSHSIDTCNLKKRSALHLACRESHALVVRFLLERGASPNLQDHRGETPLMMAVQSVNCVKHILLKRPILDLTDRKNSSALHHALRIQQMNVQQLLISAGASVDVKDVEGVKPRDLLPNNLRALAKKYSMKLTRNEFGDEYKEAVVRFNKSFQSGIDMLLDPNGFNRSPTQAAHFVKHFQKDLSKIQLGELFGDEREVSQAILKAFTQVQDFRALLFDDAIRVFLAKFRLPGEAQKIDRIMEAFASRYFEQNSAVFPDQDTTFLVAFSLIMLNTDLHSPHIKHKMTKEQFLHNSRETWGPDHADPPRELYSTLYDSIKQNEIQFEREGETFSNPERKGVGKYSLASGKQKKQFFVLKDNVLYFFQDEMDQNSPSCIIPLENMILKVEGQKRIVVTTADDSDVKVARMKAGAMTSASSPFLKLEFGTVEDRTDWFQVLNQNVVQDPFYKLLADRAFVKRPDTSNQTLMKIKSLEKEHLHQAVALADALHALQQGYEALASVHGAESILKSGEVNSLNYALIIDEDSQVMRIIFGGVLWNESLVSHVTQLRSGKYNYGEKFSVTVLLNNLLETLLPIVLLSTYRKYAVHIGSHSLGAIVAPLFALAVSRKRRLTSLMTFGQPHCIPSRDFSAARELPCVNFINKKDPSEFLFDHCVRVGLVVTLTNKHSAFDYSEDFGKRVARNTSIDKFLRKRGLESDLIFHDITLYLKRLHHLLDEK